MRATTRDLWTDIGAEPRKAIQCVQALEMCCVAGNHDRAVIGKLKTDRFIPEGEKAVEWTRGQIDLEEFDFLNSLALIFKNDDFLMVHGALNHPEMFQYLKPEVLSLQPGSGRRGDEITIHGRNFGTRKQGNFIYFDGKLAQPEEVYPDSIKVLVPMSLTKEINEVELDWKGFSVDGGQFTLIL